MDVISQLSIEKMQSQTENTPRKGKNSNKSKRKVKVNESNR